jgi:hypothetical protein
METDTHDRRICPRAAAFTRTDRRRLERALKRTRTVPLYRRLQGVLGVAEGEPVHAVAHRVQASRVSLWRWVERYLARRNPQDLCDPPRPGPLPRAPAREAHRAAGERSAEPRLRHQRLDGAAAAGAPGPRGPRTQRTNAASPPARGGLSLEATTLCL